MGRSIIDQFTNPTSGKLLSPEEILKQAAGNLSTGEVGKLAAQVQIATETKQVLQDTQACLLDLSGTLKEAIRSNDALGQRVKRLTKVGIWVAFIGGIVLPLAMGLATCNQRRPTIPSPTHLDASVNIEP